jgi:hypothetical protein
VSFTVNTTLGAEGNSFMHIHTAAVSRLLTTTVVAGACGTGALAASAASAGPAVPPHGRVAGGSYSDWLAAKEKAFFETPSPGVKACATLHRAGGTVAYLNPAQVGGGAWTCDVPANEGIYVNGVSNECSTLKGDHNGFGTSAAQLEDCARTLVKGLSGTASVDGRTVSDYGSLFAAAPAQVVHIPAKNGFGIKHPETATTAAYGEGMLLSGWSSGTHKIHVTGYIPASPPNLPHAIKSVQNYTVRIS